MAELYSQTLFGTSSLTNMASVRIDDNRILIVWSAGTGAGAIAAISYGVNNALSISPSTQVIFESGNTIGSIDVALVNTDKAVVTYVRANLIRYIVLGIDESVITTGTAATFITPTLSGSRVKVTKVDTDRIACIQSVGNGGTSKYDVTVIAATISGTVATFGSSVAIQAGNNSAGGIAIESYFTNSVAYTYHDNTNESIQARTLTGTTVNAPGTAVVISPDYTASEDHNLVKIADNAVTFICNLTGSLSSGEYGVYAITYTFSGTTITLSTRKQIHASLVPDGTAATMLPDNLMIVVHKDAVTDEMFIHYLNTTPTDIFLSSNYTKFAQGVSFSVLTSEMSVAGLSDGGAIVFYKDEENSRNIAILVYFNELSTLSKKRNLASGLQISWKKQFRPEIILFTIGVSTIGGNDIIAPSEQLDSQWNKYLYSDESQYLLALDWEQNLNMPVGGVSQGLASGLLENTTGRFLPRYMGGTSELFTSILPRRPFIINAGFENQGVQETDPQFVGIFTKQPEVNVRERTLGFSGADFINFLGNRYVDNTEMYTGQRSDQLIEVILNDLGYTTAQYELDTGINTIPFAIFTKGENLRDIIHKITQAENAHFYQDNEGLLRFENRQHWDSAPYNEIQWELVTGQVIDAKAPDDDHIINVVEIRADIREKQPLQTVYSLPVLTSILIPANEDVEQFFAFEDPVLELTDPVEGGANSFYLANSAEDGSGTDKTSSITIANLGTFAEAVKYRFRNNTSSDVYITQFVLAARIAKNTRSLYYRAQDDSSVTAFEERPLVIENPYIHEETWAASLAQMILTDYAEPENLQEVTIMAISSLKLGDLVSWQGRPWRVFSKRTRLDPSVGFIQDLLLLQRTITSYFRIGISTIGGVDLIAP